MKTEVEKWAESDNTGDNRQLIEELKREQRWYRTALQASQDSVFEYDIINDELRYCDPFEYDRMPRIIFGLLARLSKNEVCDKKQIEDLEEFLLGMKGSAEIRFRKNEDDEQWYCFKGKAVYEDEQILKIVGRISDITEEKKQEKWKLDQADRDGLTGGLCPSGGLVFVEDFFRYHKQKEYAFIYIDIRNINTINNTYGHPFGDAIIKFTAYEIKQRIKEEDLLIRIGGCQFFILCKDTREKGAEQIAADIWEITDVIYTGEVEAAKEKISIAIAENMSWDGYPDLPQIIKLMQMRITSEIKPGIYHIQKEQLELFSRNTLGSKEYKNYQGISQIYQKENRDLLSFGFEILEKSRYLSSAINMLLYAVGKTNKLRFIHIYEMDCNYLSRYLEYQWFEKEADKSVNKIGKYDSAKELKHFMDSLEKAGSMEIAIEKDKKSYLDIDNYPLKENAINRLYLNRIMTAGQMTGIILYASERKDAWSEDTTNFFSSISKLIAVHMEKERADGINRARTQMLSRISHEIRTPVNGIVGMLEIMKTYLQKEEIGLSIYEKMEECISKAKKSAFYMISVVDDILEMEKLEKSEIQLSLEPFCMDELTDQIEAFFRVQAELKNIKFILNKSYKNKYIVGDLLRIVQVFAKLLDNALKFTLPKGIITVEIKELGQANKVSYRFSVKDTGCGISEEEQRIIFRPYGQSERGKRENDRGTGTGLTISRDLVSLMGGVLEVNSGLEIGTEMIFVLDFPICEEKRKRQDVLKATEQKEWSFSGKRILLAEDNELNAEIAETLLCMQGFDVEKAEDGLIAYEKFYASATGYYNAIIMDIRMPNMDGWESTQKIRTSDHKEARTIPIIAMTSDTFDEYMERTVLCGMNGYLPKPVQPDKMMEILNHAICG